MIGDRQHVGAAGAGVAVEVVAALLSDQSRDVDGLLKPNYGLFSFVRRNL
jgi:hypothetical protein